jgi:alpha-L-fucosidase 2
MRCIRKGILFIYVSCLIQGAFAQVSWPDFLGRNDMVWNKLPAGWDNAPFVGNGRLGAIFWMDKRGALHLEVSRGDLYDHRSDANGHGVSGMNKLYARYRLPNGHFELTLGQRAPQDSSQGRPLRGNMRLDLWNALVNGQIERGDKQWNIRCFAYALSDVIVLEVTGDKAQELEWFPDSAKSTRPNPPALLIPYPAQVLQQAGDIRVSVQDMPAAEEYFTAGKGIGQYATAWKKIDAGENKTIYLISMGFSYPGATAVQEAVDLINQASGKGIDALEKAHGDWWHNYYPKSFLSVPDASIESFYWIQLYKMASASRQGGPVIDLMGPWFMRTGWPEIWWNLNIQLTYWPFYMSNHLDMAEPLAETLWNNRSALARNAAPYEKDSYAIGRSSSPDCVSPVGSEVGNLPWVMHNLWMYYRSSMDDRYLKDQLFPLLKGSFNYLDHIVRKQPDGVWSLPVTASPEYTDGVLNSSYTLACLRWLSLTLIRADARLKAHDPVTKQCRKMLAHLAPYETDSTGFMVGKGMPFAHSHRHWSHLFMIYPFHEYAWDNPAQNPLMTVSLNNWLSMPKAFAGYSWLGAAGMLADDGRGDEALAYLHSFLKKSPLPNTLYREGSPVIETPLAFARIVQELLMTSYGDVIRIFPGVPAAWGDVVFDSLRAEGAFLVSARRSHGVTEFVRIKSLAGEPCRVATGMKGSVKGSGESRAVKDLGNGMVELTLPKGAEVILYTGDRAPEISVKPVTVTAPAEPWGEHKS